MSLRFIFSITIAVLFVVASFNTIYAITNDSTDSTSIASDVNLLEVRYEDNTAPSYQVFVNSGERYTVQQSNSWIRDESSRYNLVAYSIDGGDFLPISRFPRGNFTLDITMNTPHTVVFLAKPQVAVDVGGIGFFEFYPPSPTGDNWFDINSEISITLPKTVEITPNQLREQLVSWSVDKSATRQIERSESGVFTTPKILMSNTRSVDFVTMKQYYVNIKSQYGNTEGGGWYDVGSSVTITVTYPTEFFVRHIFDGWDGIDDGSTQTSVQITVDGPKSLIAKWKTDYSQMIVLIIIPISIGAYTFRRMWKGRPKIIEKENPPTSQIIEQVIQGQNVLSQTNSNKYYEEMINYARMKSIEKLDLMHNAGQLSDDKFTKIKESLEKDNLD